MPHESTPNFSFSEGRFDAGAVGAGTGEEVNCIRYVPQRFLGDLGVYKAGVDGGLVKLVNDSLGVLYAKDSVPKSDDEPLLPFPRGSSGRCGGLEFL